MPEASVGVGTAVAGTSKRAHVSIAICTRDRPLFLERCVRSLFAMTGLERIEPELLVVENAPAVSATTARLVRDAPRPWRASACAEPRIGIPFARNRAVEAAVARGADALVFLDDDQTVPPDWLATLLEVQAETGADAVQSALNYVFEQPGRYDTYVATGFQGSADSGVVAANFLATHGVLIVRPLIEDWGIRFDERAPLAGGSDTRFFLDAKARGAELVLTDRTIANEHCPPEKQNLAWILGRQRRRGYVLVIREVKKRSRRKWFRNGCWRIVRGTLGLPIIGLHPPSRMRELIRIAKGIGILQALLGRELREYDRILGR